MLGAHLGLWTAPLIGSGPGAVPADFVVTTDGEWATAIAAAVDGDIIELSGTNFTSLTISGKAYATGLTIRCDNSSSKVPNFALSGTCTNITFKNVNFQVTGWPRNYSACVTASSGTHTGITFDGCTFRHGYGVSLVDFDTDFAYSEYNRISNVITATTTSSRVALSYQDTTNNVSNWFEVFNRSTTTPVYFEFGNASVVATLGSTLLTNNGTGTARSRSSDYTFAARPTHVAAITASGTAEMNARSEIGFSQYLASAFAATGAKFVNITIKNCTFTDLNNGIKAFGTSDGDASDVIIFNNTLNRIYQDNISMGSENTSTSKIYVLRNTMRIPFARSGIAEAEDGDARDPHGDLFQLYNTTGSETVYNTYSAGNRVLYQPIRSGVTAQGNFWSDANNLTTGFYNAWSISDTLIGGSTNGISVGEDGTNGGPVDGLYVYGATIMNMTDGASSVSTMRIWPKASTHSYVEKSLTYGITNEHTGTIFESGNYELSVSAPSPITTIFPNWSNWSASTTVAETEETLTTTGDAAGIGAVATRDVINWSTTDPASVIRGSQLPPGVDWANEINLTASSTVTLPLRRVLNAGTNLTVSAGTGVEWRSYESDGTTLDTDWTSSSGTINGLQWIQFRTTASATPGATLSRTLTINGFAVSVDFTTAAAATNTYLTFQDETANLSSGSSKTFAGVNFGTADANRVIVVAVFTGSQDHSGVDIGGSAATKATGTFLGGGFSIWYRAVSSGSSGDIVVSNTSGNLIARLRIAVWSIYPSSATPRDAVSGSAAGATSAIATDLDVASGGYVIWMGGYHTPQTAQYSVTWSGADGVNTRVDGPSNILEANAVISAGDISITETNSTFDMTLATTNATSNNKAIVAASWDA